MTYINAMSLKQKDKESILINKADLKQIHTIDRYAHLGQWLASGDAFNVCGGETKASVLTVIETGHFLSELYA